METIMYDQSYPKYEVWYINGNPDSSDCGGNGHFHDESASLAGARAIRNALQKSLGPEYVIMLRDKDTQEMLNFDTGQPFHDIKKNSRPKAIGVL